MLSFESDYTTGAHPKVLERLLETNLDPQSGYGTDAYCESARGKIRAACGCPEADVWFLTGGTQTNAVAAAALLESWQGVVAAETGHVSAHEAGAIEHTGHKVLTLPQRGGKLCAAELEAYLAAFFSDGNHDHMVFPGMVYISHPTEYGTLYTKDELIRLADVCRRYELPLYCDGARLACALASCDTDVTLPELALLCDVFTIGGTKCGALCGEALVFPRRRAPRQFLTIVKQNGALLAKGRLLGVQFDALFTDGLYEKLGAHAVGMAGRLKELLREKGLPFFLESPTNQQFVILENGFLERFQRGAAVSFWERFDEAHTVVRFATSWSTAPEDLERLSAWIDECRA